MSIKKSLSIGEFSPDMRWEKLKIKDCIELSDEELEFCVNYTFEHNLQEHYIYNSEKVNREFHEYSEWSVTIPTAEMCGSHEEIRNSNRENGLHDRSFKQSNVGARANNYFSKNNYKQYKPSFKQMNYRRH